MSRQSSKSAAKCFPACTLWTTPSVGVPAGWEKLRAMSLLPVHFARVKVLNPKLPPLSAHCGPTITQSSKKTSGWSGMAWFSTRT